jgi:hypothetical protein
VILVYLGLSVIARRSPLRQGCSLGAAIWGGYVSFLPFVMFIVLCFPDLLEKLYNK